MISIPGVLSIGVSVLSSSVFSSKSSPSSLKSDTDWSEGDNAVTDTWFDTPPASTSLCLMIYVPTKVAISFGFKIPKEDPWFEFTKLGPVSRTIVDVTEISAKSSTREMLSNVTLLLFWIRIV